MSIWTLGPDEPTPLLQALGERRVAGLPFRIVDGRSQEHADSPHVLVLARAAIGHAAACVVLKSHA
jgi:hypothetical protein